MAKRVFTPTVIETKENFLQALRQGDIKSSKYNLLNEEEKLFVELVVFGEFSTEQAMQQIHGDHYRRGSGCRMCARPQVADALEELSYKKNIKFMSEISSARDMALRKAMYILNTTEDEAVALAASKLILDKSEKVTTEKQAEQAVNAIQFNINMAPKPVENVLNPVVDLDAPVLPNETLSIDEQLKLVTPVHEKVINEETNDSGLDFSLSYSNINNYE